MVVDVVVEMDDIDMTLARIEMARDKLTTARIARSVVHAKGESKMGLRFRERVNAVRTGVAARRRALKRVKTPHPIDT
jgi:hypothetical protein